MFALFTVVPKAERAYIAPIVPLYLFYAITHIAPMTVGFANWIAMKLWGRRVYRDHYEPLPSASTTLPLEEKTDLIRRRHHDRTRRTGTRLLRARATTGKTARAALRRKAPDSRRCAPTACPSSTTE